MERQIFVDYAINQLGHNPNSYAFEAIVNNLMDLHNHIEGRKKDKKDSMYIG